MSRPVQRANERTVHVLVDFKSGSSYLLCNRRGPLKTLPRDYKVDVVVLPFETSQPEPKAWQRVLAKGQSTGTSRPERVARQKALTFQRYAQLQQLAAQPLEGDEADSHALLVALAWTALHAPQLSLEFAYRGFEAFHDSRTDHRSDATIHGILRELLGRRSPASPRVLREWAEERFGQGPIRMTEPVAHSERLVFGTPCVVAPNGVMGYLVLGLSMIRLQLDQSGLARRAGVVPDVACAWRIPEPVIDKTAPGMPGSLARASRSGPSTWLARYRSNSLNRGHRHTAGKVVRVYLDIKSPHAYLAVEMAMALEEDFDVHIDWLPFDLALASVYGDAKAPLKKGPGSRVPTPSSFRTEAERAAVVEGRKARDQAQFNLIKWSYGDLRRYANLRGITLFGTERVWDSRLILKAMLYCKSHGRHVLDRFLVDVAFPRLWRREANLEDLDDVRGMVEQSGAPGAGFSVYAGADGPGNEALDTVLRDAVERDGVYGVPSFACELGESAEPSMFFGKEHLSLIRIKLLESGLGLRGDVAADVPYLWRPSAPAASGL